MLDGRNSDNSQPSTPNSQGRQGIPRSGFLGSWELGLELTGRDTNERHASSVRDGRRQRDRSRDDRASARPRPRISGAERHGQPRSRRHQRHGCGQRPGRDESEHRRHLRLRPESPRQQAAAVAEGGRAECGAQAGAAASRARRHGQRVQSFRSDQGAAGRECALAGSGWPGQSAAIRSGTAAARENLSGLPRDARAAEGHRCGDRRDARSHACGDRLERDGSGQARLRAEADVLVGARGTPSGEEGQGEEGRRAARQSTALGGRAAACGRVHPRRRDWRSARGARLDEPAVRLLAAGCAAAGGDATRRPAGRLGRPGDGDADCRRHGDHGNNEGRTPRAGSAVVGAFSRRCAGRRISPRLPSIQLARLGRLGSGRTRRHGRAPHRLSRLGLGSIAPVRHRDRINSLQRRVVSCGHHHLLRVPVEEGHHQDDVVRRRPDAAGSVGTQWRQAQCRWRDSLRRPQRQAGTGRAGAATAAGGQTQFLWISEGTPHAHPARRSRDELDQRHQGQRSALVRLRVRVRT